MIPIMAYAISRDYDDRCAAAHLLDSMGRRGQAVHDRHVASELFAYWKNQAYGYDAVVNMDAEHYSHIRARAILFCRESGEAWETAEAQLKAEVSKAMEAAA